MTDNNNPIITAYNNFKTLIRQITYSKDDIDEKIGDIDSFITSTHDNIYPSEIVDNVTDNDISLDLFTKYNSTDNKATLDAEDDPVVSMIGGYWRSPSPNEMSELINNCGISLSL